MIKSGSIALIRKFRMKPIQSATEENPESDLSPHARTHTHTHSHKERDREDKERVDLLRLGSHGGVGGGGVGGKWIM